MFKRLFLMCAAVAAMISAKAANDKPFVIPELKEWRGGEGTWSADGSTRIVVRSGDEAALRVAGLLAEDVRAMFGVELAASEGKGRDGDIVLTLKADKNLGDEGYAVTVGKRVEVTAPTETGLYWATRTLLQMAESHSAETGKRSFTLAQGRLRDWPDYEIRGVMLDTGRKFLTLDYMEDFAKIMSYYKMNFLQIHLNDNGFKQFFGNDWDKTYSAFRMESERFPGLAAGDGFYKKSEFRDFQKRVAERHVEIMPEIDMPAHTLAFVQYKPELGSDQYGHDHLDIMKPETYEFLDALFAEYLEGDDPVFVGPRVSIGTDEYSNRDREVVEKFRYLTDRYIRYVESFGKQASVWGSLTHAAGQTPVKVDNVLMHAWSRGYANPKDMADLGYKLVSIPDGQVYIVPAAGYYYDYLNIRYLYNEWTPANVNGVIFPERDPSIAGGMFAVWNDHVGNGISTRDIHHRAYPALQTLAVKCWTGKAVSVPFDEFNTRRHTLSEAPSVNLLGRHTLPAEEYATVWKVGSLAPDSRYELEDVGYDYVVEFDIECADETWGTELFRSRDAVFYLADPVSGMLGFARDGYLNRFRYSVGESRKMHIAIAGDNRATRLYIDGRLADELVQGLKWYNEKSRTAYVPTLVFPLRQTGRFNSRITNFEVKQK